MKPFLRLFPALATIVLLMTSCAHIKVDPIEVKEIHIVQDVNIHVDKELDEYFAFQGQPATQPATTAAAAATTQAALETGDVK